VSGVLFGVMTARLDMVMLGVARMAVSGIGMMRRLLVITGLVMLRGLAMVLRRVLVMLRGLLVVLDALVLTHHCSPGLEVKVHED